MCTGICWVFHCPRCASVVFKDRHAVRGHTCRQAQKNGSRRGACQTGIEWRHYAKRGTEVCLWCDLKGEMALLEDLGAEGCKEADLEGDHFEDTEAGCIVGEVFERLVPLKYDLVVANEDGGESEGEKNKKKGEEGKEV